MTRTRKKLSRRFKQRVLKLRVLLPLSAAVLLLAFVGYTKYMENQRLSVDPASYQPLLKLIGKVESNNNYNAHFGNSRNTSVNFTNMTIADVQRWQTDFVANGSPSSAVGKYQIINTTLDGLARQLGLGPDQKFDEATQDKMAITLLERRGSEQYVNEEISEKEFAANLAKEWAALPKTIGKNPQDSYYQGDGLNKARVETKEVLKAIEPIKANEPFAAPSP